MKPKRPKTTAVDLPMVGNGGRNLPSIGKNEAAAALSAQYARAIAGVRDIVLFGAMMHQLGNVLSRQNVWGADNKGKGLKAWLAENCPEIHYKTAHSFLALARAMVKTLSLPDEADVPRIMAADAAELAEEDARVREAIDAALAGKSKRQLEFDFGLRDPDSKWGGAREGAGRKAKDVEEELAAVAQAPALLWASARGALDTLVTLDHDRDFLSRLSNEQLAAFSETLAPLLEKAGEILADRAAAAVSHARQDGAPPNTHNGRNELRPSRSTEGRCIHCDDQGFCTNESNQGGGFRCFRCEAFQPANSRRIP